MFGNLFGARQGEEKARVMSRHEREMRQWCRISGTPIPEIDPSQSDAEEQFAKAARAAEAKVLCSIVAEDRLGSMEERLFAAGVMRAGREGGAPSNQDIARLRVIVQS